MINVKITKVKNDKLEHLGWYNTADGTIPNVNDSIYFNGPQQLWVVERHWALYSTNKEQVLELFVQDHSPLEFIVKEGSVQK